MRFSKLVLLLDALCLLASPAFGAYSPVGSFTISPAAIPANHSGNITLTLTGDLTSWDGTTVFNLSGVSGVTKVSQNVASATATTVIVTTGAGAGTLTITENVTGSATNSVAVAIAALATGSVEVATEATAPITLTGSNTLWSQETAAGLFSIAGGNGASIGTPTVFGDTSATVNLTPGAGTATLTITDNSTLATTTISAHPFVRGNPKSIGVTQLGPNGDSLLDYFSIQGSRPNGDTSYFQAWAANSMLPLFPNPSGLPILGTENDGSVSGTCTGTNVSIMQLSKLPAIGTAGSSGNTLLTPVNCTNSFGSGVGGQTGWAGETTAGGGNLGIGWKGAIMAFRNHRLLAPFYRQNNAGSVFGDSSLNLSPDAGQTWIDYGHYNTYTVTGASWSANKVTLTVATTAGLSTGNMIYVHDAVPPGYNGKATITVLSGTTLSYTLFNNITPWDTATPASNPGVYVSGGAFGLLKADGSAPVGPGDPGYNMMWPMSGGENPMNWQVIINYGQDGNYPSGIDSACEPTVWICGLATNMGYAGPTILFRVPVGREMNKALYQWYYCPSYNGRWPQADTVCDGNLSSSWTSTLASATSLVVGSGHPGYTVKYSVPHRSYVMGIDGSYGFRWAPHPWGPFYDIGFLPCSGGTPGVTCYAGFNSLLGYGENVLSTTPPRTQLRISMNSGYSLPGRSPGGNPTFWSVESGPGRVPAAGIARRADYLGVTQYGMGHRFVSGNQAGAISRRGRTTAGGTYALDWWADLWDHGGVTAMTGRPYFRDVLGGGSKYFSVMSDVGNQFSGQGTLLLSNGIGLSTGYKARLMGNANDSVLVGNPSWTIVTAFNITAPSGTGVQNHFSREIPIVSYGTGGVFGSPLRVTVGKHTPGDLCVSWGGGSTSDQCIPSTVISANTWYFLAVSAEAQGAGAPILRIYLGTAGTVNEYGGANLATSATGSSGGGLIKTCSSCSLTPATTAAVIYLGWEGGQGESLNGIFGEAGVYSGAVPGHVIRGIYRTLRTDWARVGRGAL